MLFVAMHLFGGPIISGPQKWKNALDGINAVPFGTYKKKTQQSHWKCVGSDWYLATMEVSCTTMLKPVGDLLLRNGPFRRPRSLEELWRYDHRNVVGYIPIEVKIP